MTSQDEVKRFSSFVLICILSFINLFETKKITFFLVRSKKKVKFMFFIEKDEWTYMLLDPPSLMHLNCSSRGSLFSRQKTRHHLIWWKVVETWKLHLLYSIRSSNDEVKVKWIEIVTTVLKVVNLKESRLQNIPQVLKQKLHWRAA